MRKSELFKEWWNNPQTGLSFIIRFLKNGFDTPLDFLVLPDWNQIVAGSIFSLSTPHTSSSQLSPLTWYHNLASSMSKQNFTASHTFPIRIYTFTLCNLLCLSISETLQILVSHNLKCLLYSLISCT